MKIFWGLLFLSLLPIAVNGQVKYEQESRLRVEEVPLAARAFIQQVDTGRKVKWYYEENLEGNSVEAKFKRNCQRYSVEFDTLGNIQDVEIEVKSQALSPALQQKLLLTLDSLYQRHKIRKIQQHYQADKTQLLKLLQQETVQEATGIYTAFELIVKGKQEQGTELYELLLSPNGALLEQRRIIFKNATHLEY